MPTTTFSYTGGWQTFNVPAGVTSVTVDVKGAGGGGSDAGSGGRVQGKIAVDGSQTLRILVGQAGSVGSGTRVGGGGASGGGHFGNADGGSGGGASQIRLNSTTGTIKCVAGGGGGESGDNGDGGDGGTTTGESGARGTSGSNSTGNATGGTQSQGGNGGTSSSGSQFNGSNASDSTLATGGAGGEASASINCHGGGGGGGGYKAGGGGQASSVGFAPGGGGGGGSNYTGGLTSVTNTRGGGGNNGVNGSVSVTWITPPPANQPPSPPTSAQVNGVAEVDQQVTKSTGNVSVSAVIDDPDSEDSVRLVLQYATNASFTTGVSGNFISSYGAQAIRRTINLTGLQQDTRYFVRLWTQDTHGVKSLSYNSLNFWTNRSPNAPVQVIPVENASLPNNSSTTFEWNFSDPDPGDTQTGFELRYRTSQTSSKPAGVWTTISQPNETDDSWVINPFVFKGNTFYDWQVRTKDNQQRWGFWSLERSFFATSPQTPPILVAPINDAAVDVSAEVTFDWRFVDPDQGDKQSKADFRYRVVGTPDWINILPLESGDTTMHVFPPETFVPGYHYEWQMRTYDYTDPPTNSSPRGTPSDWTDSETFWSINAPGSAYQGLTVPDRTTVQGSLGCGTYQVFVYAQGGQVLIGEIDPVAHLTFNRVRDDISNAVITTNGFGQDCCELLASLRSWMHEIVLFRDGVRVWEGPITRIGYKVDEVEIEAKDVMAYAYRRIMRQGYDDAYRTIPGEFDVNNNPVPYPAVTVVQRATQILVNALAPHDPNVIGYMTPINNPGDAHQRRVVPDYSKTAWEEVDSLAATAGLDYTTVGRRIILWDTHRPIGRLPEMRDGDFSNPPIVTEYGMQLSNYFAVTNGSGIFGAASPQNETVPFESYGPIEMLASAYGEAAAAPVTALTAEGVESLRSDLEDQAERGVADRWPSPLVVRVPDNSTLNPEVGIGFDQLIPGVHIPLRAVGTCRVVAQWQKLDSISVDVTEQGEKVAVVMSPAPNGGEDPDDQGGGE